MASSAYRGIIWLVGRGGGGCSASSFSVCLPSSSSSSSSSCCCCCGGGNKSLVFFSARPSSFGGLHRLMLGKKKRKKRTPSDPPDFGALRRPSALPETADVSEPSREEDDDDDETAEFSARVRRQQGGQGDQQTDTSVSGREPRVGVVDSIEEEAMIPTKDFSIVAACVVGLFTGIAVVVFNNAVHEIRDLFWDGIPSLGASWLREEPLGKIWQRVILVPACGGVTVGLLNTLINSLEPPSGGMLASTKGTIRPILKAVAASVTLGTGNSLGPEGPSVEIGASIAEGVGNILQGGRENNLSLVAAGSAAGISSGFNAAVAGCFFAVESVLWPSPADSSSSLTNSTSMVILSAVIASVISEIGLGSDPAFTVPEYDFRSPKLPLYLLLGVLCGLVSLTLSRCTSYALEAVDYAHRTTAVPKAVFPALGGLTVGLMALAYPEILYWGFENVDILLESRPFVKGLPADLLLQLVGVKIVATSLSRASGLVGGYYAPSLFIGAATGMAYGKFMGSALSGFNPLFDLPILEVASPQAYGLVGMAATLAGVCQLPLTSVLLLFELTHDYRIVLPLLGAVGLSSFIASTQSRKRGGGSKTKSLRLKTNSSQQTKNLSNADGALYDSISTTEASYTADLCELESSLCVYEFSTRNLAEKLTVSQAMQTRYITVLMSTSLIKAIDLMLAEKQSCVVVIDDDNCLVGLLALEDIEDLSKASKTREKQAEGEELLISEVCHFEGGNCRAWAVTPNMTLLSAESIMDSYGVNQLPVVTEDGRGERGGRLIGLLGRECIGIACRAMAAKELLGQ